MTKSKSFKMSRRAALGAFGTASGTLILQSLATGIPVSVLLDPLRAHADEEAPLRPAKTLILSSSRNGDPVNANVPGTYGFADTFHPLDPEMAETAMTLGTTATSAAKPWATLPQHILDRTAFFHHATYTPVHGELPRVQRMMDATEKSDMLVSLLARELAPRLGSVQSDPVSLGASNGGELLSAEGRILGNVAPLSVRAALGGVDGPLKSLTAMRDAQMDRIHALYHEHGTKSQRRMLDAWARSRDEVRSISTALVSRLDGITGNDQQNQVKTAAVLAAMNISPVITLHLDFGRDNHTDTDLAGESTRQQAAIADMRLLMEELDTLQTEGTLTQDVIIGSLNVFGRTLKKKGTTGRDHNSGHHCLVMMGNGIAGGIVGGIALDAAGKEYIATPIDSATGTSTPDGDIPYEDTLGSAGKTLGVALGVPEDRMDEILTSGKPVHSIIAPS